MVLLVIINKIFPLKLEITIKVTRSKKKHSLKYTINKMATAEDMDIEGGEEF